MEAIEEGKAARHVAVTSEYSSMSLTPSTLSGLSHPLYRDDLSHL